MKKVQILASLAILFSIGFQTTILAQENPEDIALDQKQIEINFYEAITQRGIENYDKAIIAIQKAIELEPKNDAFWYELGKNLLSQKKYIDAESAFNKAIEINDKQRWYWNGLYDVYYDTKAYQKAIPVLQKLITFDPNMKEDLVSVYMFTNQHDKALELLKTIEASGVLTAKMEQYKLSLSLSNSGAKQDATSLENAIKQNPKYEQNYIDLILLYSTQNQEDKAFEIAKKLELEIPNSDWASISLIKFYIANNDGINASKSLFKILENTKIDFKIKHRAFNEFLIFATKNPDFYKDVDAAIPYFNQDASIVVAREVANYFLKKNNLEKATYYLEMALKNNSEDLESIDLYLETLLQMANYEKLNQKAASYSELFPSQPLYYYYNGLALNKLNKFKTAKEVLETGLDFVIDNKSLETNFYLELIVSCEKLNDNPKKQLYLKRVKQSK